VGHYAHQMSKSPGAAAAFFDVDNTIMRGASIFYLAMALAKQRQFTVSEMTRFAVKQVRFVTSGSENLNDVASVTASALAFVEGRSVEDLTTFGESVFDDTMVDKLIPGSLELAKAHLDAGEQVWLVTATPVELAELLARRLGLTGALGTVSEIVDGRYTGRLIGRPLHGPAKAEAIRQLAAREDLDLSACAAYSDSANDIPMLSAVGHPTAVNPDPKLRKYARTQGWAIVDFRRRHTARRAAVPLGVGAASAAAGLLTGYLAGRAARRIART
jgi:HAD superfamily hydrolase (TIGR01490 family)